MRWKATACAMCCAALAVPAAAEEGFVGELVELEVEDGGREAELRLTHVSLPQDDAFGLNAALGYGITDRVQVRAEIAGVEEGERCRRIEGLILSLRWKAVDPNEAPLGLGIQAGLAVDPDSGRIGSETFFVAQSRLGGLATITNLLLTTEPGDWSEVGTSYGLRTQRAVGGDVELGVELGGTLSGEGSGSHFVGPVASIGLGERRPELSLAAFAPLSEEAPGFQARLALEMEF